MQLINAPGKLVLPFAASGAKNAIPVASQIGIVAGAASLTDGFPPLTRTPLAAGGVPPSGLDMNGIIYELSAILRWVNAGAGYVYDGTFATDSNVGGYPKGARVLRSDGRGYWFNTVENNTTDPEAAGAAAAGWVPDFTNGVTSVAMASANVTLTPLQYGKPIIVITGTLTANLNLIFPTIVNEWTVINNTTGPYTITCKTAAGTGVPVSGVTALIGDGTNIQTLTVATATTANDPTFADNSTKAASTGWIRGAMSAIATAAGFATSFATNGYIKFPSWLGGWIVEWGLVTFAENVAAGIYYTGTASVTFPLQFPTAARGVMLTARNSPNAIDVACYSGVTTTGFTIVGTTSNESTQICTVAWLAVGD